MKFLSAERGSVVRALTSKPGRPDTERVKWMRADMVSERGLRTHLKTYEARKAAEGFQLLLA